MEGARLYLHCLKFRFKLGFVSREERGVGTAHTLTALQPAFEGRTLFLKSE